MISSGSRSRSRYPRSLGTSSSRGKYFLAAPALRPVPPPERDVIDPDWEIADDIAAKVTALARYLGY